MAGSAVNRARFPHQAVSSGVSISEGSTPAASMASWMVISSGRCSAAAAYLHPNQSRPNLAVLTGAHATRILFDGKRAVVATVVHSSNTDIPIDYRMVRKGSDWFVYDVLVEDISLIKNYRSSYGEIVRKEGYAGLFERMRKKITELQDQPAADGGKT